MASKVDLTASGVGALNEANDETIKVTITTNVPSAGTPLDLTGKVVEAFLKTGAATADGDATTWKGSTATAEITVTDAAGGKASISVPAAAVTTAKKWWRCDVLTGGLRKTAAYGDVSVTDL